MTLQETIQYLEGWASEQPNINSVVTTGDIFDLNKDEFEQKYSTFCVTQGTHNVAQDYSTYNFILYYVDRLTLDKSNKLEIQSTGTELFKSLINKIMGDENVLDFENGTITPFTERFTAECAGVYMQCNITATSTSVCKNEIIEPPYKHVDLGLPSGTLWAQLAIGQEEDPKGVGKYFSWANVDGHYPDDGYVFNQYNYNLTHGSTLTENIPFGDEYDPATANWGDDWCIPMITDFQEVSSNCDRTEEMIGNQKYYTYTSRINGNKLVIPNNTWSKNKYEYNTTSAYALVNGTPNWVSSRYNGFMIKPIRRPQVFTYTQDNLVYWAPKYAPGNYKYGSDNQNIVPSTDTVCCTKPIPVEGAYRILYTGMADWNNHLKGSFWFYSDYDEETHTGVYIRRIPLYANNMGYHDYVIEVPANAKYIMIQNDWDRTMIEKVQILWQPDKTMPVMPVPEPEEDEIDLGLPSGNIWCTRNIGASHSEEFGYYFSWGNVEGHIPNDGYNFTWDTYQTTSGYTLNSNIPINADYDAAQKYLGVDYIIPKYTDYQELLENTNQVRGQKNGINGVYFQSRIDSSKSIFFPYGGYIDGTRWQDYSTSENQGQECEMWSNRAGAASNTYPYYAYCMEAYFDGQDMSDVNLYGYNKALGFNIRAIKPKAKLDTFNYSRYNIKRFAPKGAIGNYQINNVRTGEITPTSGNTAYIMYPFSLERCISMIYKHNRGGEFFFYSDFDFNDPTNSGQYYVGYYSPKYDSNASNEHTDFLPVDIGGQAKYIVYQGDWNDQFLREFEITYQVGGQTRTLSMTQTRGLRKRISTIGDIEVFELPHRQKAVPEESEEENKPNER